MKELNTTRVRHSMLIGAYTQLKNYLDCVEQGYLGKLSKTEEDLVKELRKTKEAMNKVLKFYFDNEELLMNGD
jgi:hypothetical protein